MCAMFFPKSEYEQRWERVLRAMRDRGAETVVVWGRSAGTYERCGDVLYLTNYYSTHSGQGLDTPMTNARGIAAVILRAGCEPELQADDAWPRTDLMPLSRAQWSHDTVRAVIRSLVDSGTKGRVLLVGSDFFPMKYWAQLKEATPNIAWVVADDLVLDVRKIKSARELDACREAGRIASVALDRMMEALVAGRSEAEAAGEAAREVFRAGGHIHMIPISHGRMIEQFASDPLSGYSQTAPEPGDLVRGWVYGPMFQGYWMDPGRTAVAGRKASAAQRELIEITVDIVDKVTAAIRPGVVVADVARLGDRLMQESGAEKDQAAEKWPSYGHGCGLTFERQQISLLMGDPGDVFEANMVLGVETFFGRKGVGSAGFEQNIIVHADRNELITPSPVFWW